MMRFIIPLLIALNAFAGQSITFGPQLLQATVPNTPSSRVEFYLHDWTTAGTTTHIVESSSTGWRAYTSVSGSSVILTVYDQWETVGAQSAQFEINGLPQKAIYVRAQHDAVGKQDLIEAWDINGTHVYSGTLGYTTEVNSGGTIFQMGFGSEPALNVAFMRNYSTLVPINSRPPVTVDTPNRVYEWKFDGTLTDASGNGYTIGYFTGTPAYVATPYQNVISVVKTADANSWTNVLTQRAGSTGTLDGTASYSQNDTSATVTYFWQQLSGPSSAIFSSRTSGTPGLTGLIFGDYKMQLTVTDAGGLVATASDDIGAVAQDSKGVVVNAVTAVDDLLGNMLAYGKNPWGYQDYWTNHASQVRTVNYAAPVTGTFGETYQGWSVPLQWEKTGQGTVDYFFNCRGNIGPCGSNAAVTTVGTVSSASTTIVVNDGTIFTISSFPTRLVLYDGVNADEFRVCSLSVNTYTLCYDPSVGTRHTFAGGTTVLQSRIQGSGTLFVTDPNAAVCPTGIGGALPGIASYSTGTVSLTANSTTVTGSGTTFATPTTQVGEFIQVSATHSATPFIFVAKIASVNSTTGLTLSRPFPSTADTASGLAYKIMPWTRALDLTTTNPVDSTGLRQILWPVTGCESETDMYVNVVMNLNVGNSFITTGHDIPALDGTHQTAKSYSVTDTFGWVSQQGTFGNINFYGEDMANWALYYRSGRTAPQSAAQVISTWWARSPFVDFCCSLPLSVGGGRLGAFISVITGQNTTITWKDDLRLFASEGADYVNRVYPSNCSTIDDSRDLGYVYAQLILAAIYDPDISSTNAPGGIPWRTYWQNQLANMQSSDTACAGSDGSFSSGFYFVPVTQLTMTNGSAAVTGTSIPSTLCTVTDSGTGSVTNGSSTMTVLTGTMPTGGDIHAVMITGVSSGSPFVQYLSYTVSGSTATLGAAWAGTTGTVTWQAGTGLDNAAGSGNTMLTIAESNNDTSNLLKNWACVGNSSSSITLNRVWDGVSSGVSHTFFAYLSNLAGFGQQPFMLGIRTYGQGLLANQTVPALSTYKAPYTSFQNNAASWVWSIGMDPVTLTTNYGVFAQSSPVTVPTPGTSLTWRSPASSYGLLPAGLPPAREQNTETGYTHVAYYLANPTTPNKTQADQYYGAVWGNSAYNTGGVYSDANSTASNVGLSQLTDASIANGKWFGFFAGMGQSHRWPAVRVGGLTPPATATIYVPFTLSGVANSTKINLTVTLPTGTVTTTTCTSSPCTLTVDHRSGNALMRIDYLNNSNVVLSPGDNIPLYVQ